MDDDADLETLRCLIKSNRDALQLARAKRELHDTEVKFHERKDDELHTRFAAAIKALNKKAQKPRR